MPELLAAGPRAAVGRLRYWRRSRARCSPSDHRSALPQLCRPPSCRGSPATRCRGCSRRMGVVYKARHLRPNRPVALKMLIAGLRPAGGLSGSSARRRRCRTAAPNVVHVYDVGDLDGRHFSPWSSWRVEPSRGNWSERLPCPRRRRWWHPGGCRRAAHAAGIVHRDLKPSNVLDRRRHAEGVRLRAGPAAGGRRELTLSGTPMGTQLHGLCQACGQWPVDRHGDGRVRQGAILRVPTGRPPFKAEPAQETLQQVLTQERVAVAADPEGAATWRPSA